MAALSWGAYERMIIALMLWREARNQSMQAQEWVVWTVRNRCKTKGWWNRSGTPLGAVLAPYQYSSITNPRDGQLTKFPCWKANPDGSVSVDQAMLQAMWMTDSVLDAAERDDPTGGADSYYDESIPAPPWANRLKFCGKVGAFHFFRILS